MTPEVEPATATDALAATLRRHSGIARLHTLRDAGHSRRTIERARADGLAVVLRHRWLALPDADPDLVIAAEHGVVQSCVTQARRLGLFVLVDEDLPHVAAPAHSGRITGLLAHVHWARPVVSRHPHALTDAIENVLTLVASCLPFEEGLVIWESALRKGMVQRDALGQLDLPASGRRLLAEADPYADSGLETIVVPRLRWLRLSLRRQIWIAGHHVDLLIGDRLVLQIDGGHHVGAQRESDIAHDARLMLLGYHVIRVGYGQVMDGWAEVQQSIMLAVAQGLHRAK